MEKYLGVKLIEAEPMNRIDPTDNSEEVGYRVKYEDGYESWSPKDVFEKAYRRIRTGIIVTKDSLQPHEERVINEVKELDIKITALDNFIENNEIYKKLSEDEQIRLIQQVRAMEYYFSILVERIENF